MKDDVVLSEQMILTAVIWNYQKKLFLLYREEKLDWMPKSNYKTYWDKRIS